MRTIPFCLFFFFSSVRFCHSWCSFSYGIHVPSYADVFSAYNLYRDAAISSQCATMWVEITGLLPKCKYSLVFCPYDWSYGRTYTVSDWTSGAQGANGTFSEAKNYVFTADTPEDALTVKMKIKSDATGRVLIRNSVASGCRRSRGSGFLTSRRSRGCLSLSDDAARCRVSLNRL